MSLSTLPIELLTAIFSQLSPEARSALWGLSLCNRHFHAVAEPLLYRHFIQHSKLEIPCFFRTIVAQPHLLRHVRSMEVSFYDLRGATNLTPFFRMSDLSFEERMSLQKYMPNDIIGPEIRETWLRHLFEDSDWHAAVALLLALLSSSLECVQVHYYRDPVHMPEYISVVLNHASGNLSTLPFFPNLYSVLLGYFPEPSFRRRRNQVHEWLMIPTVREMKASNLKDYSSGFIKRPLNSHTTHLTLDQSLLEGVPMVDFLSNLCGLEYFSYHQFGHSYFSFKAALNGLASSRHTLKSLTLSSTHQIYPLRLGMLPWTPDFSKLPALEFLDVDIEMLVGWRDGERPQDYTYQQLETFIQTLPENLKSLTIRGCGAAVNNCMDELFVKRHALAKLKKLKVSIILILLFQSSLLYRPFYLLEQMVGFHGFDLKLLSGDGTTEWEVEAANRGVQVALVPCEC
jgi:F-box-like